MKVRTTVMGYPRNESPGTNINTHILIKAFTGLSGEIHFSERYFPNQEALDKALKALSMRNAVFYMAFGLMPEVVIFHGTIGEYLLWNIEIAQ